MEGSNSNSFTTDNTLAGLWVWELHRIYPVGYFLPVIYIVLDVWFVADHKNVYGEAEVVLFSIIQYNSSSNKRQFLSDFVLL